LAPYLAARAAVIHRCLPTAFLPDAPEKRDELARPRVDGIELTGDARRSIVAKSGRLQLYSNPPVNANFSDVLGVAGARAECQPIECVRDLLIRRELACLDARRLGQWVGRPVRRRRARQLGERGYGKNDPESMCSSWHEVGL
jgi:hypothetical protein